MSWEIVREDREHCACRMGFVSRILKADDWNRTEITVSLMCSECKKNYVEYTYDYHSSGMLETATRWVKKEEYEVFCRLETEFKEIEGKTNNEINEYLYSNYYESWMALFDNVPRNKKAVWNKLYHLNLIYFSYSKFCKNIGTKSLDDHIKSYVSYPHKDKLLKILGVRDENIGIINAKSKTARIQYEEVKRTMIRNSF
ncbi:hypothetical protein [Paenibacillus terrae]|uniref:Uncharacterized protein n=1 Tax=Paenibacillus terrae TaxID=159743 RepID=A0A0D7WT56_9BACL|nr:hypothetical protein [Paenibacillus terrae]KJD42351.1 hypothetical protein QD47_28655 [Paenibacillus terrae]